MIYSPNISLFMKGESMFSPYYVCGQIDKNKSITSIKLPSCCQYHSAQQLNAEQQHS